MEITKVASNIKKFRELKSFTQEYMANNLNISQAAYSKIEKGDTNLTLSKLDTIAKTLEVDINNILDFDEKMFFNISNNQNDNNQYTTQNGVVFGDFDKERKLYDDQINLLKDENKHLKEEVEFLRKLIDKWCNKKWFNQLHL